MTESNEPFDRASAVPASTKAPPQPSAPPLDNTTDENLPVATPVADAPAGGPRSTSGGTNSLSDPTASSEETTADPEVLRQKASGIAAAVVGFFLGGPFLSLLFGGGAYYAATQRPSGDAAGDAARSLGDVALVVRDKAVEIDEKHDIVDKTKNAAGSLWQKSKAKGEELNEKHDIIGKSRSVLERMYMKAVDLNNEYHIIERARQVLGNILETIANKLNDVGENGDQEQRTTLTGTPTGSTSSST
mmetsp:Transcript_6792/g.14827  ORF Transcript_6792/g.14827 Transcript_6792/m.14827 type:complete len:246 (+) Transcript_6792:120-857(+)